MNCIIPSLNIKVFAKALNALAKIGDEIFIDATPDHLTLVSLNLNKTICARFHFLSSFFSIYEVNQTGGVKVRCKIHMKVVLPLFKGNLDKKLEFVRLEYESNSDVVVLKFKYKVDDIIMVHKLRLMDAEALSIQIDSEAGFNNITATSSLFTQLLNMFSSSDDEIILELTGDKVTARNYILGAPLKPKSVRSQVNLTASEFNIFRITQETTVFFSMKPLRTAIHFAEGFKLNIGFNFELGGRPLAINMKNPTFEVNFIAATLNPYSDGHTLGTASIPTKITQINCGNLTLDDRQALENENWDDEVLIDEPRNNIQNDEEKPESPRSKKLKIVFGRCLEATYNESAMEEVVLAPASDSE